MKVFRIGTSELGLIDEALEVYQESIEEHLDMLEEVDRGPAEYDIAHIKTTRVLLKDMRLQELCERCLSYFWDRFKDMGCFSDEIELLMGDMGIDEDEMEGLFREAGFEE